MELIVARLVELSDAPAVGVEVLCVFAVDGVDLALDARRREERVDKELGIPVQGALEGVSVDGEEVARLLVAREGVGLPRVGGEEGLELALLRKLFGAQEQHVLAEVRKSRDVFRVRKVPDSHVERRGRLVRLGVASQEHTEAVGERHGAVALLVGWRLLHHVGRQNHELARGAVKVLADAQVVDGSALNSPCKRCRRVLGKDWPLGGRQDSASEGERCRPGRRGPHEEVAPRVQHAKRLVLVRDRRCALPPALVVAAGSLHAQAPGRSQPARSRGASKTRSDASRLEGCHPRGGQQRERKREADSPSHPRLVVLCAGIHYFLSISLVLPPCGLL